MSPKPGSPISSPEEDLKRTPVLRTFLRWLRAFSVGVGFGLLPFLVENPFPGFQPLIQIFPRNLKPILLTLAPLVMGAIAIAIDFYWDKKFPETRLSRWFRISILSFLAGLLLLVAMYKYFIVPVIMGSSPKSPTELYVIGWSKQSYCDCGSHELSECIEGVGYKPANCWGSFQVNTVELAFQLSYLAVNFGFGTLIGLLMLRKRRSVLEAKQQKAKKEEAKREAPPPRPAKKPKKAKKPIPRRTQDEPEEPKDAPPTQT